MAADTQKTRDRILDAAEDLILAKSFHAVGINEILGAVGVPKGSFYHYFASKEDFGVKLIERYAETYRRKLHGQLFEGDGTARDRLLAYLQHHIDFFQKNPCTINCLVVKLSGEIAGMSPPLRDALDAATRQWISEYTALIRQGHDDGSLPETLEPEASGVFLYTSWLGAMTQVAVHQSHMPFETLFAVTKNLVGVQPGLVRLN
jgi:TetR/AcrR family transcriptional repressor of nem operon